MDCASDRTCAPGEEFSTLKECVEKCHENALSSQQKKAIRTEMFELMRRGRTVSNAKTKIRLEHRQQEHPIAYFENLEFELSKYKTTEKARKNSGGL